MKQITIGIRYRLFLAFLASACCVVVSMFLLTRSSFERGAFRYVNQVEKERLKNLALTLEQAYGEKKQWRFLEAIPSSWMELVAGSRQKYPHHLEYRDQSGRLTEGHGPSLQNEFPPLPQPKGAQAFELRVMLLDADRHLLVGPGQPWAQPPYFLPLKLEGIDVGHLGLIPPQILVDLPMRQFAREQQEFLLLSALSITAAAALVSIPLAGKLVRHITTLASATTQLASGRYDIRVPAEATDELGQLARDFNKMAQALEKNEHLRRRWVADISHELRTPLAILRGEVEAVQDGVRQLTPQTMGSLHSEILHLSHLVDDLYELALADIGALTYRKENVDLRTLVEQAVQSYQKEFSAHFLTLEFDTPVNPMILFGDAERLRQMATNLLQNTLRYSNSGGKLRITCNEEAGLFLLHFADSAPGVPEEALAYLFDRLYRVEESRNRAHGGAGLGLALCKSIVEAHNGSISAGHSSLGGLEISIILPKNG